ncbi:four helix bundle protein [Candidatus Gracilibacteria bacterium]|nr:four helix bundle protein [Candidatus Gracilibacteria bacterium]
MNYKELKIWQKGFQLALSIYEITKNFPSKERFGIIDQMRRSAVSIPSNIAEGAGRKANKDFSRFCSIAQGSCNELETQTLLAKELKYMTPEESCNIQEKITEISKMIHSFQKKLTTNN